MKKTSVWCSVVTALALLLGFIPASSAGAETASPKVAACASELTIESPDTATVTKRPVLLVHGWMGEEENWGAMKQSLRGVQGVAIGTFNYYNTHDRWVTDPANGPKLARHIECLAQLYNGPVTIVAHSMGGLMVQKAASETVNGRKVGDLISLLIAIGTPFQGSPLGNLASTGLQWGCDALSSHFPGAQREAVRRCLDGSGIKGLATGSEELKKLPPFPSNIPIKAIAGSVTLRSWTPWGDMVADTQSDMVVPVVSATAAYTQKGVGDGKKVFACDGRMVGFVILGNWCEHSGMLSAPEVQAEVKASIETNLAATKPKPSTPPSPSLQFISTFTLKGLQIPLAKTWELQQSDGSQATVVDTSTCKRTAEPDYWKLCAAFTVAMHPGSFLEAETYTSACPGAVTKQATRPIGSRTAQYYELDPCVGNALGFSPHAMYVWEIRGKVTVISQISEKGAKMTGVEQALAEAVWK